MATEDQVRAALSRIVDPATGADILSGGQVKSVRVQDGKASFVMEVDPAQAQAMEPLRKAAEEAIAALDGIASASGILTAHAPAGQSLKPSAPPTLRDFTPKPKAPEPAQALPGVKNIIAVASGKGGVGKSTVSSNLAVALAGRGVRVGLLDADVYGPSQPRMLGVSGRPSSPDGKTILPLRNHGVTIMSLGLMVEEGQAIVWRGPMLMGALQQMLGQVQWGQLDTLIVDLPPGTGDVQMTLAQKTKVAGAVIVSTPQDIALIDARKGIDMFNRLGVPILGLVENMSGFVCGTCGTTHYPFGQGGAEAEAKKIGAPFLGAIPLHLSIREASDGGAPVVVARPESEEAAPFWALADRLIEAGVTK